MWPMTRRKGNVILYRIMQKEFKKYMMSLLNTGGHCKEMKLALNCKYCGTKFKKAEAVFNRYKRENPELVTYKQPEFQASEKTRGLFGQLLDRINKDKLYKRHLKRMAYGTEEEKDREIALFNKGYYRSHYEKNGNILIAQK